MTEYEKIRLKFANKLVAYFYHPVPDAAFLLFQEGDRVYTETPVLDEKGELSYHTSTCSYVTTAGTALRRLRLMGYSSERVKEWFEKETEQDHWSQSSPFDIWRKCVRYLFGRGIPADDWLEIEGLRAWRDETLEPDVARELSQFEEWDWGLPGKPDARQLYCVLLEDLEASEPVELDCNWGHLTKRK